MAEMTGVRMPTWNADPLIDATDPVALVQQAVRLDDAYQSSGRIELGEQAAEYFLASVAVAPDDYPDRALLLSGAAMCLQRLFDRTGRAGLLEAVCQQLLKT